MIIWTNVNDNSKTFESTYLSESFLVKSNTAQRKPESKHIKIEDDKINLKYYLYLVWFFNTNKSKIA